MSKDFLSRDSETVWHPFTVVPNRGPRSVFVKAEGAYLFDERGNRFFDATSSWWCNLHGHCHPRLVAALTKQAGRLDQILFAPHTHPIAVELAERLLRAAGNPFRRVFYSDDGSTAVEAALKMVAQYWVNQGQPKRTKFLSLEMGYHGDTLGAVSVSHVSRYHDSYSSLIVASQKSVAPYCYRCPLHLTYPSCQVACLEDTQKYLASKSDEVAALIIEPLVLGAAGMITYPISYVEKIVSLCKNAGVLVIFDEVFTGFGRTGSFFAMDQIKEKPDVVCLSKGLTAGMLPLGATLVTEKIYQSFVGGPSKAFYHGHTFTANALSCAVALESLNIFEDEKVLERNRQLVQVFEKFKVSFEQLRHVGQVRHLGMIWAIELVKSKESRGGFQTVDGPGWKIARGLWEKGYWIRPLHNVLYLVPPYCTLPDELHALLRLLHIELQDKTNFEE